MRKAAFVLFASVSLLVAGCQGNDPKANEQTQKQSTEELTPVSKEEHNKVLNEVKYYQPKKEEQKPPAEHSEGEKLVEKKLAQKKELKDVKKDLQDKRYRQLVIGAATDLSGLNEKQIKEVAKYAKYVDQLDSQLKNKRIQELEAKLRKGKLSPEEFAELKSLLPIKGGTPISLESTKKQPPKEKQEPQPKSEESNQQPSTTPKDEGFADGDAKEKNKEEQPSTEDTNGNDKGGFLTGIFGGEEKGNPKQEDDQKDDQQKGLIGGEKESDQNGQAGEEKGGQKDDDQSKENGDQKQGPVNGYDPIKARDYAYKWWDKRNNEQYPYYSRVSGGCYDCWSDCTNFVSQAIFEGGIKEQREGGSYWYYSDKKPAYAWGVANSFYNHFKTRAEQTRDYWDLEVGDVVSADFDHDGDIEHSAIVTRVDKTGVYVTQHTADRKDAPLITWFLAGYEVYGWKMKTANH